MISRGDVICGLSVRYRACAPVCVCVCGCVHEYASMFVCAPISSDGVVHKQKIMYPPATQKTKTVLKRSTEVAGSCVGFCLLPYVAADDRQTLHTTEQTQQDHIWVPMAISTALHLFFLFSVALVAEVPPKKNFLTFFRKTNPEGVRKVKSAIRRIP